MSRASKSRDWMREHVNDPYVRKAQADGYRSRAAYKLREIDARDRLLAPGQVVVDLGAAPGSWSQVAAARLGRGGLLIALDLLPVGAIAGMRVIQGDFREAAVLEELEKVLDGRAIDLVLSDLAPNLSGVASADQARSVHLAELALDFCSKHLKKGGNFLVKVFQGAGFTEYRKAMQHCFKSVQVRKPDASRGRSSELYLLGKGFHGPKT